MPVIWRKGTFGTGGASRARTSTIVKRPATVSIQFLVLAGGGSGGTQSGAGGGAGGYRNSFTGEVSGGGSSAESAITLQTGVDYTITVGGGGAGSTSRFSASSAGSNSQLATITSTGGGKGAGDNQGATTGGSGGGGYGSSGGSGTSGQGYAGGNSSYSGGGGGGGAGGAGGATSSGVAGNAGIGVDSYATGAWAGYGGGGAGAYSYGSVNPGSYYVQYGSGYVTTPGTANTGGGGGGGSNSGWSTNSTSGGSGIIVIKIPNTFSATFSAGITVSTTDTSQFSGYNVYTITAGTGTVNFAETSAPTIFNGDFIVIGGGGGGAAGPSGGDGGSGGGGAGGYRSSFSSEPGATGYLDNPLNFTTGVAYPITIGAGSTAASGDRAYSSANGSSSILGGIVSYGGGRGAPQDGNGVRGASGGGAGGSSPNVKYIGGTAIPRQGYDGGTYASTYGSGAGGGGAGGVGGNSGGPYGGNGGYGGSSGLGLVSTVIGGTTSSSNIAMGTGSKTFTVSTGLPYAAGEYLRVYYNASNYMWGTVTSYSGTSLVTNILGITGSGTYNSWTINYAYAGGGAATGYYAPSGSAKLGGTPVDTSGSANTGSGGGGGSGAAGGGGGSGLAILKIPNTYTATFSAGITATNYPSGSYNIYKITAGTGTVTFS